MFGSIDPNYPNLSDYLISLLKVSQSYKDENVFDFSLMAKMLQEAFIPQSLNINWEEEIVKPFENPITTIPNSPEYFQEYRSYNFFNKRIKNMIIDLLRIKQGLPLYMHWENFSTEVFLERAASGHEISYETEILNWGSMTSFIRSGQYTE